MRNQIELSMMKKRVYIPLTLTEIINGLQGIIQRSNGKLTGEEYVIDVAYISEPDDLQMPPGSIALFLQIGTTKPDEFENGTIVLTPGKLTERPM